MTMRAKLRSLAPGRDAIKATRLCPPPVPLRPRPAAPDDRVGPDTFEWRMRESDGPVDLGHYACACGFQFAARVATTVRCPHCGGDQAW
jgi:hypothetical protein